jgi:hypothetical protein
MYPNIIKYYVSKQVIGLIISQMNFHAIFSLNCPKTFFNLVGNEGWLWESEMYLFTEGDLFTAFDNVVYNLTHEYYLLYYFVLIWKITP